MAGADWQIVLAVTFGYWTKAGVEWLRARRTKPYKWHCPLCTLQVQNSSKNAMILVRANHKHTLVELP